MVRARPRRACSLPNAPHLMVDRLLQRRRPIHQRFAVGRCGRADADPLGRARRREANRPLRERGQVCEIRGGLGKKAKQCRKAHRLAPVWGRSDGQHRKHHRPTPEQCVGHDHGSGVQRLVFSWSKRWRCSLCGGRQIGKRTMFAQRHGLPRDGGGNCSERPHHFAAWPIPVVGPIRNELQQRQVA